MFRGRYHVPLKPGQPLRFIFFPDTHWDTPECDRERLQRFVQWCVKRKQRGELVRLAGLGDFLDFGSPSERRVLTSGSLHETTAMKFDRAHLADLQEFVAMMKPIHKDFLGLLTGHHEYLFATAKVMGKWKGRSSDEWLADQFGCDYWGNGVALFRLTFPHDLTLDMFGWHGGGGAQTPGGRVQKRIRVAEIAPTAHIVGTAHDNAKLAYPRSGLDFQKGSIKRYVIGAGSFQRAYLEGPEAGYAEKMGLVPADLGVAILDIKIEQRHGRWRVDYHVSV